MFVKERRYIRDPAAPTHNNRSPTAPTYRVLVAISGFLFGTQNPGIVVAVVDLKLTRIIKSVVTGQTPVTLHRKNIPQKKSKPKVGHTYISYIRRVAEAKSYIRQKIYSGVFRSTRIGSQRMCVHYRLATYKREKRVQTTDRKQKHRDAARVW